MGCLCSGPAATHTITIDAPIELVWKVLTDLDHWQWNKWTRLEAQDASIGAFGKMKTSMDGIGHWKTYPLMIEEISDKKKLFSWKVQLEKFGLAVESHRIQLSDEWETKTSKCEETKSVRKTKLEYKIIYSGFLSVLGLIEPKRKRNEANGACFIKALKSRVEKLEDDQNLIRSYEYVHINSDGSAGSPTGETFRI
mmetsp:Transcript_4518/g.8626  ORF Transcript_4518/g.8626 Transcript_4518/m.8626 type:complete len:196 (-) Transcript_4518:263-850(-)